MVKSRKLTVLKVYRHEFFAWTSGGMLLAGQWKSRYGIPFHTVPLRALGLTGVNEFDVFHAIVAFCADFNFSYQSSILIITCLKC
jgi:hypothetical protein